MSELLNSSNISKTMRINLKAQRKAIVANWESTGLLDGLRGVEKDSVAQLYESQASQLLSEIPATTQEIIDHYSKRYTTAVADGYMDTALHYSIRIIQRMMNNIKKKHCD
jgi:hypothetical protein